MKSKGSSLFNRSTSKNKTSHMNNDEVKDNWNEQKSKLKKMFSWLTDEDLLFKEGKKEEMFDRLQIKLGKTKAELQKILSGL
jgi:uncharacterized protein YjbJ (UPF0337 family)